MGNQSTQYNLSGLVAYPRERWGAQVGFSSNLTPSSGVTASTWNQVTPSFAHLLPWNNYFYGGLASFLQSSEQGINLQTTLIAGNVQLYRFNKTNLSLNALLLPAVSEPGRVFFTTNASYYIKITGNLSWNISFYGNWDNQPPANLPGSNYGTSSGLAWTFGPSLRTTPRTYP